MGPLVSIVIPTYNRSYFIGQTIHTVLAQTYPSWELLVIDDGSTDNTAEAVGQINDSRIQYHRMEHCGVIGQVRNYGMKMAKGEYIAFLDSDDHWRNDTLACQLSLLQQFPETSFVFSNGNEFGEFAVIQAEQEPLFVGNVFLPIIMENRFCLFVSSWLVKQEVFLKTGWIDESLRIGGDVDFFLTMAYSFQGIFTDDRLVNHRKHQQSASVDLEVVAYEEHCLTMKKFLKLKWLTKPQYVSVVSDLRYKMGFLLLNRKKAFEAANAFGESISLRPANYKSWIRFLQAAVRTLTG